jgi:hypothetical protein
VLCRDRHASQRGGLSVLRQSSTKMTTSTGQASSTNVSILGANGTNGNGPTGVNNTKITAGKVSMVSTADVSAVFASDDRMTAHMALIAAHMRANCVLKATTVYAIRMWRRRGGG